MLTLLIAGIAQAQSSPVMTLGRPEVEHPAQWTGVAGVRELRDGRVVVLDGFDRSLKLVDFQKKTATVIGRKGPGPGEYSLPLALFALPGDSAAIYDEGNPPAPMVITPQGTAGGVLPGAPSPPEPMFVNFSTQSDARGRIYSIGYDGNDLAPIIRLDRSTHRRDTVARVSSKVLVCSATAVSSGAQRDESGGRGTVIRGRVPVPFRTFEQWVVAPDGRIATVCPEPYQVSYVVDGKRTTGPAISFMPVPVGDAEKERWRDEQRQSVPAILYRGGRTAGMTGPLEVEEPASWPRTLPSFLRSSMSRRVLAFAPDGMLWIARAAAANGPPFYDVVGLDGKLAYRVTFPKNTKLVGFGANALYAVRVDDDDVEYLQRYRLPK